MTIDKHAQFSGSCEYTANGPVRTSFAPVHHAQIDWTPVIVVVLVVVAAVLVIAIVPEAKHVISMFF